MLNPQELSREVGIIRQEAPVVAEHGKQLLCAGVAVGCHYTTKLLHAGINLLSKVERRVIQ